MLSITHTPNLTGAILRGDYWDLDELNQAIHHVIGDEKKYYNWAGSRRRIVGVSKNIAQASRAEHHVEFVGNGLHKDAMRRHGLVTSEKNLYYSVEVLWPELIFTVIALNDFIKLYSKNHPYVALDVHVTTIRKFQAVVGEALQSVMDKEEHDQFMQIVGNNQTNVQEYAIQFVDLLNLRYIDSTKEKRQENLGMIALKLAVQDKDYLAVRDQVIQSANKTKSDIHDMSITKEYPEEIEW